VLRVVGTGEGGRRAMTSRFDCTACSFVYEVDDAWIGATIPSAPVHPVHQSSGTVVWRMCSGSAKRGIGKMEGGADVRQ
jgi:hypothetical protein